MELEEYLAELILDIWEARQKIEAIRDEYKLNDLEAELKELLDREIAPNEDGHKLVIIDQAVAAKVYTRKGQLIPNKEKARELLHPNTFNSIFTQGKPALVLDIRKVKQ